MQERRGGLGIAEQDFAREGCLGLFFVDRTRLLQLVDSCMPSALPWSTSPFSFVMAPITPIVWPLYLRFICSIPNFSVLQSICPGNHRLRAIQFDLIVIVIAICSRPTSVQWVTALLSQIISRHMEVVAFHIK